MSLLERRLVRRLQKGDERAFRELVQKEGDRVFNLCLKMLRSKSEAEDVAQDVFISVFKKISSFRGDAKLSTWIYRIAVNCCKNRLQYLQRRGAGRSMEFSDGVAQDRPEMRATSPRQKLETKELQTQLERALEQLDEEKRLLIILRDVEDLSYADIGAITDIPTGTVKSRIHRARKSLREILESTNND